MSHVAIAQDGWVRPSTIEIGRVIDRRWRVEAEIGEGGVARVYRVRHTQLNSLHALKVLKVHSADIVARLALEGQVQAQLRHENLVHVTDVFEVDGSPGLLMTYVNGPTLSQWLRANQPSSAESEALFRGVLAGVARAHAMGVVHRDLKPGNILLAAGKDGLVPKVCDFGLAKVLSNDAAPRDATQVGTPLGTPAYMAPEQFRGTKDIDQRADIFALGCIFYEMLCGQRPFGGQDLLGMHNAIATGRYAGPEQVVPGLPPRLAYVIHHMLAPERDQRPANCEAVLALLDGEQLTPIPRSLNTDTEPSTLHVTGRFSTTRSNVPTGPVVVAGSINRDARVRRTAVLMAGLVSAAVSLGLMAAVGLFTPRSGEPAHVEVAPVQQSVVTPFPIAAAPVFDAAPKKTEATLPTAPPPKPSRPKGSVQVTGDAKEIVLIDAKGRRYSPRREAKLPVGVYDLQATFEDGTVITRERFVEVRNGETFAVRCQGDVQNCFAS